MGFSPELVVFPDRTASLRDPSTGETMHSSIGAWEEANQVYVAQSDFAERLSSRETSPLVLYDVGLGIGANALAALSHYRAISGRRRLEIVSFEKDLSGIRFALENAEYFPFLAHHAGAFRALLKDGAWESADVHWRLKTGDFTTFDFVAPPPELIYFDFYSPKSSPELWTASVFRRLRERGREMTLITYSASRAVRTALAEAGFEVHRGVGTALKRETTIATTSSRGPRLRS